MGFDLNRHWQEPSPWAHPTLHATKQLVMQYDKDPVSHIVYCQIVTQHGNFLCEDEVRCKLGFMLAMLCPPNVAALSPHQLL